MRFERLVIKEIQEKSRKGLRRLISAKYIHTQGMITPPRRPMPLAMPTPVVLILVGYTSAVYWNLNLCCNGVREYEGHGEEEFRGSGPEDETSIIVEEDQG